MHAFGKLANKKARKLSSHVKMRYSLMSVGGKVCAYSGHSAEPVTHGISLGAAYTPGHLFLLGADCVGSWR